MDLAACSGCVAPSPGKMGLLASSGLLNRRSGGNQGHRVPLPALAERRIGNPKTRYSRGCACQAMQDIGALGSVDPQYLVLRLVATSVGAVTKNIPELLSGVPVSF